MGKSSGFWIASALACGLICAIPARADLYQAAAAVEKNDLPRAFELYREIAELGHPRAQEILAAMYVNGEGVARDNVLGYAWAKLALETGGGGEIANAIVSQLESRLGETSRAKVAALHAEFGREALTQRILPVVKDTTPMVNAGCKMKVPGNPAQFYPASARADELTGSVIVEAPVGADGSSRTPRAVIGYPAGVFEEAARGVALYSRYEPPPDKSAKECLVRFRVNFNSAVKPDQKSMKIAAELRAKAEAGDPLAQLTYGAMLSLWPALGSKPDERPALWFLKAAQAGAPAAQFMLGAHLMSGNSFEQDKVKGVFWLEQSAKGGSGAGQTALASYLLALENDAETRARGYDWMRKSAESTHREGKFLFAALLASWPDETRRDPVRALALLDEVSKFFDNDPLSGEIRARALAARGDFAGARKAQKRAIDIAKHLGWNISREQARLQAYEQGKILEGELIEF